jgi:hypothetical protein
VDRVGELVPLVAGQLALVPLEPAEAAGELAVQRLSASIWSGSSSSKWASM